LNQNCGICDVKFEEDKENDLENTQNSKRVIIDKKRKIECGHYFHEFCIRGWVIIGKKNICPLCKEKGKI
jgi:hypothetical protein